jgi:hypothetical protein
VQYSLDSKKEMYRKVSVLITVRSLQISPSFDTKERNLVQLPDHIEFSQVRLTVNLCTFDTKFSDFGQSFTQEMANW